MATVRKRTLPSGLVRWQASYVDAAGTRRGKLFSKKSDADAWLVRTRRDLQLGVHVPEAQSPTVEAACDDYVEYIEGRNERGERMTTKLLLLYKGHINNHILHPKTGLAATKIGKLSKSGIGEFRDRLRNGGMTVKTARKVLGTLCRILDLQISKDRLAINQARKVTVIGTRDEAKRRIVVPEKAIVRKILEKADSDGRAKVMFAAATGARAGEQWATRWRHIDMTAKEVTIETRVDAYGDEDVTKSEAGMRTIPLSDALVTELRTLKLRSAWSKDDDLVFPNAVGKYISHSNFLKRDWPNLLSAAKAEHFQWHHLRHFAASCWIEAGFQPKTVQTFIGHATIAMTMDLYGHLFKSDDHKKAMDAIAAGLFS